MDEFLDQLVTLQLTPYLGEKTLGKLLTHGTDHIRRCFTATEDHLKDEYGFPAPAARYFSRHREKLQKDAQLLQAALRRTNARVLTSTDPNYPDRWQKLKDAPPLVYAAGDVSLLSHAAVCLLASSTASEATVARLRTLADGIAHSGYSLVTGHNRNVYQATALSAAHHLSPVIYVLDCGLFSVTATGTDHPFAAARLHPVRPQRRLFLSSFRPNDPWIGYNNRRRDQLIAALSSFIVAVDIRPGGVMEKECLAALKRGQRVVALAPEGRLPSTHGSLFEKGAMLIQTPEELLKHLSDAGLTPSEGV